MDAISLLDYKECTEIENGYAKHDGVSSCVTVYTDNACTNEKSLTTLRYEIKPAYGQGVEVCNKARYIETCIFLVVCVILFLIYICLKCSTANKSNKNEVNNV